MTALIERLDESADRGDAFGPASTRQLVGAVALARGVVDLAGSYGARRAAFDVWQAALRATAATARADRARKVGESPAPAPAAGGESLAAAEDSDRKRDDLRLALEDFLKAVRGEVGGESRPRAQVDDSKLSAVEPTVQASCCAT